MTLHVSNLTRSFDGKIAVDHISFDMTEPGVFGLIGTNGAGKTTTIRMILGILTADEGEATWNGKKITRESVRYGYLPEERGIYSKAKVIDQIVYFGALRGMNEREAKDQAIYWLDRFKVMEYKDQKAEKLSKGNQQKIQMIISLINDPELIFLDEPFSGLDPVNTELLSDVIKELVARKKFVLMNSHQMSTIEDYAENILILNRGKTVLQGNLKEIKAGYGHTNLIIDSGDEFVQLAEQTGLKLLEKRADEAEFLVGTEENANRLLSAMVDKKLKPTRFILREPSLKEIFIEKVGGYEHDTESI
ncbi:MAG: ATP-binding cassette domain-containing protein [Tissierellia bacterium]|nr:ATP-binding cassette domain-containing protein [Tissierellia bacterium]